MPIIVNNQPQPEKTTDYRLSIQVDLNGFSFSVVNENDSGLLFLYASDFRMDGGETDDFVKKCSELFEQFSLLRSNYDNINLIYNTHKYSLVPNMLYKKGDELSILERHHKLDELDEVNTLTIPHESMVVIFAVNSTLVNLAKSYHPNLKLIPTLWLSLTYLPLYPEYNKLSFNYMKGFLTIVAAEGEKIVYCNSFPAHHFNTALYFLFLTIREVQFNPESTTIYISGNIRDFEKHDMTAYFSNIRYFRNPETPLPNKYLEQKYSSLMFKI